MFNYIHSQGYNISRLKSAIDDLVVKTVLALLPEMKVECAYETSNIPIKQRPEYFQVNYNYFIEVCLMILILLIDYWI